MDEIKARELEAKLAGARIDRWTISEYIDNGKSAAVFSAYSETGERVAIKIFDDEIIKRYGDETQLARIDRELELSGHFHPNLVRILGGGVDAITGNHYIAMEYVEGPTLGKVIGKIDVSLVPRLVQQLAEAAQFLETLGFVHRDIKPDNIKLTDNMTRLVLLDLGVIRPLSGSDITDAAGIQEFVGTLRYSSPEFLLRLEDGSADCWRAVTFYQIGGVIHDLVMGRPLFDEYATPYARLVNAVQNVVPEIQNPAFPTYLVELARFCLLKQWPLRLQLVRWQSFRVPEHEHVAASAKQRVTNRAIEAHALEEPSQSVTDAQFRMQIAQLANDVLRYLAEAARTVRSDNASLPPVLVHVNTPDSSGICIQLSNSTALGIPDGMGMVLQVEILDVGPRLIRLSAAAKPGHYDKSQHGVPQSRPFFTGTMDASTVYEAFESCLYDLIEMVQQGALDGNGWAAPRGVA